MPSRRLIRRAAMMLLIPLAGAALAGDSPQFRGPARDGIYPETGLLAAWPEAGPRRLWSAAGLGEGFASLAVADGRIYTTGMEDGRGSVLAFDLAGKMLWKREYGAVHSGRGYPGTRTTPTYHEGLVYIMTSLGEAVALDAATGEIRWRVELSSRDITWGIAESPLVFEGKAIFTPGGPAGTLVALDAKTGERVWAMTELEAPSAYCSPRLLDTGRHRQIVTLVEDHMIGVDPASGKLLWRVPRPGRYGIHAVSPVFFGSSIYVSDGYQQGGTMFDLAADGASVAERWREAALDVHHGGVVLVDGRIYGAASNGTWHVLDAAGGKPLASIRRLGKGSIVYADGRLYGYTEKGEVLLVDPDPGSFRVVGRARIDQGSGHHWAHPVISGRVLYIRRGDALMAFDIAAPG